MKNEKKPLEGQPNLFGEGDHLLNTLEETKSDLKFERKACQKTIDRNKKRIVELDRKIEDVDKARKTAKKIRDKELKEKKEKDKK